MIDFVLNVAMLATVGCVILFFWTKQPKYGFIAATLLAIVPVMQLLLLFFSPKIDVEVDKMRALMVPLQIVFSGFCGVCAVVMYRVAKKAQDNQ
jgi:hypothetical protein